MSVRIALKAAFFGAGLFLLDSALRLQRMSRAQRMKLLLGLAIAASITLLTWSLVVVVRVNSSTKSMISDGLVGINTTIALGRELTEIQAKVVTQGENGAAAFSPEAVEDFRRQFEESFRDYADGVFSPRERHIADEIASKYHVYLGTLQKKAGEHLGPVEETEIYKKGQDLRLAIREAAIYNAERLETLATNVRNDTQAVFVVFCILAVALVSMMALGMSILMFTRFITES